MKRSSPPPKMSAKKRKQFPNAYSTITAPRKQVKKRNAKRAAANHERAYGEHADYIRSLGCCVCGHQGHTVAAHTKTGGMGKKSDAKWLVPMCSTHVGWGYPRPVTYEGCHEESHRIGVKSFEERYRVDLKAIASELWAGRADTGRER